MSNKKKKNGKTVVTTNGIAEVREELQSIGDKANGLFEDNGDLKAAELALKGYNGAINAGKAQLIYKKLTGSPGKIEFFEEQIRFNTVN